MVAQLIILRVNGFSNGRCGVFAAAMALCRLRGSITEASGLFPDFLSCTFLINTPATDANMHNADQTVPPRPRIRTGAMQRLSCQAMLQAHSVDILHPLVCSFDGQLRGPQQQYMARSPSNFQRHICQRVHATEGCSQTRGKVSAGPSPCLLCVGIRFYHTDQQGGKVRVLRCCGFG